MVEDQFNEVIHGPQAGGPDRDASPLTPAPDVDLPPPWLPSPQGLPETVCTYRGGNPPGERRKGGQRVARDA